MMFNSLNVRISPKVTIGNNVKFGDNTVIFDNVLIGNNTTIAHNCVIGEPLNDYYSDPNYDNPLTIIGANSIIRSHTIIYAGNKLGDNVTTGHRVTMRENNLIGDFTVIGTLSDIQGDIKIGRYCRLYSNVHIAKFSNIADFVSIYPYVVMTNDPYPPSYDLHGPSIESYTQIGAQSTILAGVKVGENCLVGANSVVTKNFPDYSLIMGNPAKLKMDIRDYVALGRGRLYPWMTRFSRGMPWEKEGYEVWKKTNTITSTTHDVDSQEH
jgi:acetyltransferase-like isoleucine patch superfamily enzyme